MIDQIGYSRFDVWIISKQFFCPVTDVFYIAGELTGNTLDASNDLRNYNSEKSVHQKQDKAQRQDDRNAAAIAGQLFLFFL